MLQGLFIVLLSAVVFGVGWGDPLAAGPSSSCSRSSAPGRRWWSASSRTTPTRPARSASWPGMLLGALGGAMVPLEIFPEPAHTIAFLTPQAWAIQGLREVALRGGGDRRRAAGAGRAGCSTRLALMALGTWRFRRILTR